MCLIIASPSGKPADKSLLIDAERGNRDGGGVAWLAPDKKKIHFKKGINAEEIHEILSGEAKGNAWVAHFRIATHGGVKEALCHPFVIDENAGIDLEGTADSVLFHNGTFSSWKEWLLQAVAHGGLVTPEAPWSDTRGVALICHVYGKHILSLLDNSSRWLVFDAREKPESRMMCWGDWITEGDLKFSNPGLCYARRSSSGGGRSSPNFRAAAEEESNEAKSSAAPSSPTESQSETTAAPTQTSGSPNVESSTRSKKKRFACSKNFNPWKSFDKLGRAVSADNEMQHAT